MCSLLFLSHCSRGLLQPSLRHVITGAWALASSRRVILCFSGHPRCRARRMVVLALVRRLGISLRSRGRRRTSTRISRAQSGVRLGLYSDAASKPGSLLDSATVSSNAKGWVSLPLTAGVQLTAGTRYWLVIAANSSKTVTYRDMGTGGSNLDYSGSGLTSPYQVSGHWQSNPASVYVGGTTGSTSSTSSTSSSSTSTTTTTTPTSTTSTTTTTPTTSTTTKTTTSPGVGCALVFLKYVRRLIMRRWMLAATRVLITAGVPLSRDCVLLNSEATAWNLPAGASWC